MKRMLVCSSLAVLLFSGCTEEKKAETVAPKAVEVKAVEVASPKVEEVKEVVVEKATEVKESVEQTVKEVSAVVEEKVSEVSKQAEPVVEAAKEEVAKAVETATNIVSQTVASVTQEEKPVLNGEVLFKACASCHGQNAEKQALGKSQIIAGWEKQKIIDALNGYKNGTYGAAMAGVMKGQVANKSDEEIDALATFISSIK